MFVDTSVLVALLSEEDDAQEWARRLEREPVLITSALVVLEAAMRLSTKLGVEPTDAEISINELLTESKIDVVAIDADDGHLAVQAFAKYGKGRGHPAQLNLADCLSYACAKNRKVPLLYKGNDFAQTDVR
ncbi:twitching motility protein PilT [Devosia insulae DS-56]|uniref:Ribonuclease VapC n=1 Tax=Devosia insulae DS-56 TaxID=1116389 RepID=A0A1E5XVA6_9HYPH|nr:type II toxin-antitoxin system VapC family toxin [Devosia insulae]OEO32516.1 twitching motility protein PilT [Devosia insulae DS-56]